MIRGGLLAKATELTQVNKILQEQGKSEEEEKRSLSLFFNTISYPDDLPVETEVLDLLEEEKKDAEGRSLVCIDEEITRKLAYRSGDHFIKETIRKKYAVVGAPEEGIKTPFLPDAIIPRCAVDESILADVIVKKFCDHLPLYRQVEMMMRSGVSISRATLSSYVPKIGIALKPLYELMEQEIKASGNLFVDEPQVDMLAPGTGKTTHGYMTVLVCQWGGGEKGPASPCPPQPLKNRF